MEEFPGRVGLQQRVLPAYRAAFFDALAVNCRGGLGVFAGEPQPQENIATIRHLEQAVYFPAHNQHILRIESPLYQCRQPGIIAWLEQWQPQVLIVEANPRYPSTRRAIRWMHTRQRPVIGWGLGVPSLQLVSGWRRLVSVWRQQPRKSLMRSLQAVIAYSQSGAQEFRDLGFPAERVFVAPNAVTHRPAGPPVERPTSFAGRPAVLFVGRLQARKRVDHLLRACAACTMQSPRLMIVGDGPARAELEQLAQAVYPAAEFFGARHGAELAEIFNAADLFVLPGTGGLAVQEAMSYALPIIVAQGDGTQTDLVRPENGWLVPADDLPALTRTLQEALTAPKKLRQMGAASYRIVDQEVNLEKMVAVFLSALWSVSAETGPR